MRSIDLQVEAVPRRMQVELEAARLVSGDMVHAGDTVVVEATLRPWQQPARNVRIAVTLPARLDAGNLRLLVSDAGTLDRALDQPRPARPAPIWTQCWRNSAPAARRRPHLCEPAGAGDAGRNPRGKRSPACRSPWQTPWNRCARRRRWA